MQPYFFPYLGYFDLIHNTDCWVVADSVQYIRHGWVNRNRILSQSGEWQYIVAPVRKHPLQTAICDIRIADAEDWRERIRRQVEHYRKRAPHYRATRELLEDCLCVRDSSLSALNVAVLSKLCRFLGLRFEPKVLSQMPIVLDGVAGAEELAIRLTRAVGADEYVNPPGGRDLYNPAAFAAHGLRLTIRPMVEFPYSCGPYAFVPHLSILDVLMWNEPAAIREYLDRPRGE
jgi:hypothetical protein